MFISSPSDFIFRSLHPIIITIMMMKEKEKEGAAGGVGLPGLAGCRLLGGERTIL